MPTQRRSSPCRPCQANQKIKGLTWSQIKSLQTLELREVCCLANTMRFRTSSYSQCSGGPRPGKLKSQCGDYTGEGEVAINTGWELFTLLQAQSSTFHLHIKGKVLSRDPLITLFLLLLLVNWLVVLGWDSHHPN